MNFYTSIFSSRLSNKRVTVYILLFSFIFINIIALINYIVDPMWCFQHKNYFNIKQRDWNERQQKTNYLYFKDNHYTNIMLGSSRTTYLNAPEFKKSISRTFNYAANGMIPYEFKFFLEDFEKLVGKKPKNIILGLDFFGANKKWSTRNYSNEYIKKSLNSFYRLKILYSLDTLRYSCGNIKETFIDTKSYYDSNFIKIMNVQKDKMSTLQNYIPFKYDIKLLSYYKKLQKRYKNSNFIIFTPPVTYAQLLRNHNNGLDEYYFRWLRDLVTIFGNVNHFMYPNEFTRNYDNFYNANHFNHISGKIISQDIIKGFTSSLDHGIILNKNNIDKFVKRYKKMISEVGTNN